MSDRDRVRACDRWLGPARCIGSLVLLCIWPGPASSLAQGIWPPAPGELADAIRVDEPAPMVRTQLERVRVNIAERQWDEAIEGLRQLMENHGERLLRIDSRFISLREFAHRQLVDLPAEGLALYRGRVDSQAQRWYEEGMKNRNAALLTRVFDELFASSYGDDALFALGEIALERGQYARARECWERISPELRTPDGLPLWAAQRSKHAADARKKSAKQPAADPSPQAAWLAYPDTDLHLADVRARLILVSLLEGALERAEVECKSFVALHPDASGRLGGRDGRYAETLAAMLKAAKEWPAPPRPQIATTFAGDFTRNFVAPGPFALRGLAWSKEIGLKPAPIPTTEVTHQFRLPERRTAEDARALLSYHPLVVNDLVVFHDAERIYVYDLQTGGPAWAQSDGEMLPGQVYPRGKVADSDGHFTTLGVPRFTATVNGSYLFVRLGSQVTSWPESNITDKRGSLVVLDLAQQGKLIANIKPENDRWSFEGPPVCDGSRFYVAMRYNDVRPQSHVACYEIVATTGAAGTAYTPRLQWRRMICAAESPARGSAEEITQNLLTLAEGTLYLNSNLGAVASLSAEDGHIHWLTTYSRAQAGGNNANLFRDLNPCLYYRGTLYVAPTDSPQIYAIDAMTGLVRWASDSAPMANIVHLLGVAEGSLIASGKQLWWLDAETGKAIVSFPSPMKVNQAQPFGRGLLIDDVVVWPTREELHVFFQKQYPPGDGNAKPAAPRDPIRLADYSDRLGGGNLIAAGEYTLLATAEKLWAFGPKLKDNKVIVQPTTAIKDFSRE